MGGRPRRPSVMTQTPLLPSEHPRACQHTLLPASVKRKWTFPLTCPGVSQTLESWEERKATGKPDERRIPGMRIRLKPGAKGHAQSPEPEVQATRKCQGQWAAWALPQHPYPSSWRGVGNPARAARELLRPG